MLCKSGKCLGNAFTIGQVVGDDFEEGVGPISTASVIATNLEDHLDKVLTGLIQN